MNEEITKIVDVHEHEGAHDIISGTVTRKGTLRIKESFSLSKRLLILACLILQIAVLVACFIPIGRAFLAIHSPAQETGNADSTEQKTYTYALRIAIPKALSPSTLSPYGPGFEQELVETFSQKYFYSTEWVDANSRDDAFAMLEKGEVNLIVGFGGELPPAFESNIIEGPAYAQFRPIMVHNAKEEAEQDGQQNYEKPFSLAADLTPHVLGEDSKGVLLDPASYALWLALDTEILTDKTMNITLAYHWFWGRNDDILDASLKEFWKQPATRATISEMTERYYGFLPKKPQAQNLIALTEVVNESLVKYNGALLKASEETDIDPLFIAAVVFQESRFDPDAVSSTGVRGIMQLTQDTAAMLKVNRLDPEECIMGGARYLRSLWDSMEDLGLDPWDRWCLALAAFNQGPGNLRKILRQVDKDQPPKWADIKKLYLSASRQGLGTEGFRGREAVDFVENVRFYYYVLSGVAGAATSERQDLAALFTLMPDS